MITKGCKQCGKEFEVEPYRKDSASFCSKECQGKWMSENMKGKNHPFHGKHHTKEAKEKIRNSEYHQNLEGSNNPNWREKITKKCEVCGKEFEVKESRKETARFCSQECMLKWRSEKLSGENNPAWKRKKTKKCEVCGEEFEVVPSRKDRARFCSRECYSKWLEENQDITEEQIKKILQSSRRKPNRVENKLIRIIKKNDLPFKYVGDGDFVINGLNPDFVNCNGKKQIIEVFGRYWHQEKENVTWHQTEWGRKAVFSQLGYDTLILWDDEIDKMSDEEIAQKIKNLGEIA